LIIAPDRTEILVFRRGPANPKDEQGGFFQLDLATKAVKLRFFADFDVHSNN
jgi:hypothetical protein